MNKEKKNLLVFGYGLAVILSMIAFRLNHKHGFGVSIIVLMALAGMILFLTIFNQKVLKTIYIYWMKGAHFIGGIFSFILLTVIFYGVFSPVGLILRLIKKDLLDRSWEPVAQTYWREKKVSTDRNRCKNQF